MVEKYISQFNYRISKKDIRILVDYLIKSKKTKNSILMGKICKVIFIIILIAILLIDFFAISNNITYNPKFKFLTIILIIVVLAIPKILKEYLVFVLSKKVKCESERVVTFFDNYILIKAEHLEAVKINFTDIKESYIIKGLLYIKINEEQIIIINMKDKLEKNILEYLEKNLSIKT